MMESSSVVPPGFRFHPTDEELVGYYLRKKIASHKIDLDVITDIDLYRIEPWDLQERCRMGYEQQNEWYFFSHKDKKYPTGTRTNRATMAGFWKATGRDKAIFDKGKLIGMRKTLVFYKGRAPNGLKTDWIMHEYRLESDDNAPPQEEGWVVCRAFKKRTTSQTIKNIEGWDSSSYLYDESISNVLDPIGQPQNFLVQNNMLCKQETEAADNLSFIQADDTFVQLPQLESPSLPFVKRPSSASFTLPENNKNNEDPEQSKRVTDWRALDKFVASQLSQEDRCDNNNNAGFGAAENASDSSPLLLFNTDQEDKFNGLLSSSSDCGIGICIFERGRSSTTMN